MRPTLSIAATAAALLLLLPAAAHAGNADGSPTGQSVRFVAVAGETNDVTISRSGTELVIRDTAGVTATGTCRRITLNEARCGSLVRSAGLNLLDGNDAVTFRVPTIAQSTVNGGVGNDTVHAGQATGASRVRFIGGDHADVMSYAGSTAAVRMTVNGIADDGRAGDADLIEPDVERLVGSPFGDTLDGGTGVLHQILQPGFGEDVLRGGPGEDAASYEERTAQVGLSIDNVANDGVLGEEDNILQDIEQLIGGSAGDFIVGSNLKRRELFDGRGGGDTIEGGAGSDQIVGGPGIDRLRGGTGVDILVAADRTRDFVDCGPDEGDRAQVDVGTDTMETGCEQVEQGSPVGEFRLSPRRRTVEAGTTATWRIAWTHPVAWSRLDRVTLRIRGLGRFVVRQDDVTGAPGRTMRARVRIRVPEALAGRTLVAELAAVDDDGLRQPFARAGRVTVR